MTYLGCDSKRRVLPVVTFVLISYLFSGELVCARPQDNLSSRSADNDTKEIVAEKVEPINNSTLNDRNGQPIVVEQPNRYPASKLNASSSPDGAKVEQKLYGDISVDSGLDFGRSAEASTSKPTPTVNTLKPIAKLGITPVSASDIIVADVRTPPKIKSQMVHSQMQSLLTPGKGEAIPVVLEGNGNDEAALEKISSDNFKYTHSDATPSSGLSTWILLNPDSISTPHSHFKKVQKPTTLDAPSISSTENISDLKKKPVKATITTSTTTTTEKLIKSKIEAVVMKKPDRKPTATIQKVNQTLAKKPLVSKIEPEEIPTTTTVVSLQDLKFKNKTPVIVGKVPSTSVKEQVINNTTPMTFVELPADNNTRKGTPVVTFPHVPVRQKLQNSSTTRKPFITSKPSVMILSSSTPIKSNLLPEISTVPFSTATNLESISTAITEETQSEAITETTTKKSSSGSKKKKKKNKNKTKRRRPSKKPAKIQSKISDDDNSTSKLPVPLTPGKPISTRIYNYLAREVMPNVGVGIVGLMLTAGLAGLLLYPFGGAIPVRRNYEKPGPVYNLNDYPPANEVDNAQPEESVLGQVIAGMGNTMMNPYSREQPDVPYKSHQKYKPGRFDNSNTYNHHKDLKYTTETVITEDSKFSELGDVVSGPHESVKFSSFDINDSIKYPINSPPPSASYQPIDITTGQNDPVYHKFSPPSDPAKHEGSVYSTLGEYTSYSDPHEPMQNPVYNGESYDYKNHKNDQNTQDFKVNSDLEIGTQSPENQTTTVKAKHEQPSFAALEGIPKNYRTLQTSIRFEDSASVLPLNQDFVPSDGIFAASIEHGPRNMRLRRRKRRDISSENEIDSILIDTTEKPSETSQPSVQFITETTTGSPFSTEEPTTTKINENIELNSTSSSQEDLKVFNSSSSTENMIEVGNKSEPVVMVTPESLPKPVSESDPQFVPIFMVHKVKVTDQPATNCENCADVSNIEEHPPAPQPFSIGKLFRQILDFKFRIGFELIRATTDVISKYLSTVQQRMTEALRGLQRSAFRMNDANKKTTTTTYVITKRERRHIIYGS